MRSAVVRRAAVLVVVLWPMACSGPQSALDPAGDSAARLAGLFWMLSVGSVVIWLGAVALWIHAVYFAREPASTGTQRRIIIGGGVLTPVVLLAAVLGHSLSTLPGFLAEAPAGSLRIHVTGYQWWWRVVYEPEGAAPVELANEIRLPRGAPVQVELESRDVIHSFWIPPLGGKVDMIPGRRTRLRLEPTETGVFRGACAEYCGTAHALMSLDVVVQEPEEFEAWLAAQAEAAVPPAGAQEAEGAELFLATGCGACHAVRGTPADGVVGPDLTHVGSRLSIAAGTLDNDPGSFRLFVSAPDAVKPSVLMPGFGMLPAADLDALAAYLESLQ